MKEGSVSLLMGPTRQQPCNGVLAGWQEFPEKQELHRNMLGLLGNVAEVRELRPQLMTSQFIGVFRSVFIPPPPHF